MVVYVAASAASAPPKRGLPLAALAPPRNSSAVPATAPAAVTGADEAASEWSEAVSASAPAAHSVEEDGPSLDELEAQMGAESAAKEITPPVRKKAVGMVRGTETEPDGQASSGPLPELDTLLNRLPPELRENVEELLRVRFTAVKRVPGSALVSVATRKA